jgi:hypothetical protein
MDENQKAKRSFITSFFDDAEARIAFLGELASAGHKREAMTLCLTYIDSFAQWLCWPSTSTGRNFVEAVTQFGGNSLIGLAHPLQAIRAFSQMRQPWQAFAEQITCAFPGPVHEILPTPVFEEALAHHLTAAELAQVRSEVWRATIANIVYQHLRNPSVHGFSASSGIILSQTTYHGQPVPIFGLPQLRGCVSGLVAEGRRRSESNWEWFGNDAIVHGT